MPILGISAFYHDAAAALIVDGRIVAAAQEERFTRRKHDPSFPHNAITYCLAEAGLRATFFVVGEIARHNTALIRAIHRGGVQPTTAARLLRHTDIARNLLARAKQTRSLLGALAVPWRVVVVEVEIEALRAHTRRNGRITLREIAFEVPTERRTALLEGIDEIIVIMRMQPDIDAFQVADRKARSWIYLEREVPDPTELDHGGNHVPDDIEIGIRE